MLCGVTDGVYCESHVSTLLGRAVEVCVVLQCVCVCVCVCVKC